MSVATKDANFDFKLIYNGSVRYPVQCFMTYAQIQLFGRTIAGQGGICWIPLLLGIQSGAAVRGAGIVLNPRRSKEMQPAPELIVDASKVLHGIDRMYLQEVS